MDDGQWPVAKLLVNNFQLTTRTWAICVLHST